jgi:predicted nucleic acid-binding protein
MLRQHLLEEASGVRCGMDCNLFRSARHHDFAPLIAPFWTEIDDPIGAANHVEVVLDYQHGIAFILVLDASAVVRIIEGSAEAAAFQQAVLDAKRRAAAFVDHIEPDRHLQVEAPALACHLDHPIYDFIYLALARREAAVLLTADQKLMAFATLVLP